MASHTVIAYPNYIAQMGGAQSVRVGVIYAWVTLANGQTVRIPAKEAIARLDSGLELAIYTEQHGTL